MTELLTRDEYGAIAAEIDLPRAPFVDGKFRKGSGAVMETVNPATGDVLAKISTANAKNVDFAVEKAREAFERGEWATAHPSARKDVLIRFAKLIKRRRHEFAAREIRAGTVTVNCYGEGDSATPFGGYKQSGFGRRDNGVHVHDQFTEAKTIWVDLSDPKDGEMVG